MFPDTTFAIQNRRDEMGQAARPKISNTKRHSSVRERGNLVPDQLYFDISQIISELIKIAFLMFQAKR